MSKVRECLFSTTADSITFTFPLVASSQMGSETFSSIKCLERLKCDDTRRHVFLFPVLSITSGETRAISVYEG